MGTASCIRKHECVSRASSFSTWLACWLALQTATDSLEIKRCCLWRKTAADLWDKSCRTKPPTRFHWSVTLYKIQSFQMLLTLWFPEDDTAGSWSQWHQRRNAGAPPFSSMQNDDWMKEHVSADMIDEVIYQSYEASLTNRRPGFEMM